MSQVLSQSTASSFGIRTYGDLKDRIALHLNRSDASDMAPDFVQLAESNIRRDVRTRKQQQYTIGTCTTPTLPVPEDFLEAQALTVSGNALSYIDPTDYEGKLTLNHTGDYYTVIGEELYGLSSFEGSAYRLLYWKEYPAFFNDTDTNWLLQHCPEVYLFASLKEAAEYYKDFEAADRYNVKYRDAVRAANTWETAMRTGQMTIRAERYA